VEIVYNGQQLGNTGWFVDGHGHRLFLQRGDLAPVCPQLGPGVARWRLVQRIDDPAPTTPPARHR
jgi:hypothetical protein